MPYHVISLFHSLGTQVIVISKDWPSPVECLVRLSLSVMWRLFHVPRDSVFSICRTAECIIITPSKHASIYSRYLFLSFAYWRLPFISWLFIATCFDDINCTVRLFWGSAGLFGMSEHLLTVSIVCVLESR